MQRAVADATPLTERRVASDECCVAFSGKHFPGVRNGVLACLATDVHHVKRRGLLIQVNGDSDEVDQHSALMPISVPG